MNLITLCLISLILLIWFKTDAFIVYIKLFKLSEYFNIDKWEEFKNTQDITVTYHQYLKLAYPNSFWIKLITCPICLGIWISIFASLFTSIFYFPVISMISLFMYYGIVKLM